MQTFLSSSNFQQSAQHLDRLRLGKQRVENLQIAKAITLPDYGWQNHPAVKMWYGYPEAFSLYQNAICREWTSRGYKDTCLSKTYDILGLTDVSWNVRFPDWLGDERLHASHRSNLLRKDPEWYGQFGWTEPDNLEYFWPTKELVNDEDND